MPRYIIAPVFHDQNLSAEAETIVRDASAPLEKWINDSVDTLQKDFSTRIQEATKEITTQANGMADDLKTMRDKCDALVAELNKAQAALTAANPTLLADSKRLTEEVQAYLKQREEKWRGVGTAVVKAVETAAKGLVAV